MGTLTVKGGTLAVVGGTSTAAIDRALAKFTQASSRAVRVGFGGSSSTQANPGYVSRLVTDLQATYGGAAGLVVSQSGTWGTLSNAAGIQGFNFAIGGSTTDTFLTAPLVTNIGTLGPDVIFLMTGTNDFGNDRPPATYKSDLQGWITQLKTAVPNAVILLLHTFERYQSAPRTYAWAAYGNAMKDIAAADPTNIGFLDLSSIWYSLGLPSTDPANLVNKADLPHPTQTGYDLLAREVRLGLRLPGLGAIGADTIAPTVPTGLTAGTPTATTVPLTWTASTDAVGVTSYRVYRGGTLVGSPTTTSYTDSGLTASTGYSYTVSAVDAAGNESAQTAAVTATTAAAATQTTIASDDFNRADGAIGTTSVGAKTWTQTGGSYTISGNKVTGTGGIATIDASTPNVDLQVDVVYGASKANFGLTFRAIDANNRLSLYFDTFNGLQLGKTVAGTTSSLATAGTGLPQTDGTIHTIRVVIKVDAITAYLNGTQVAAYTLTTAEMSQFGTPTLVGLRQASAAATYGDNFILKTAP